MGDDADTDGMNNVNVIDSDASSGREIFAGINSTLIRTDNWVNLFYRYWIAANPENWDFAANWSDVSGGTGGFSVPNASNVVVVFDGSGLGDCTINANTETATLTIESGYTGTLDVNDYTNDSE